MAVLALWSVALFLHGVGAPARSIYRELPRNATAAAANCWGRRLSAREGYVSTTQSDATLAGLKILCQEGGNAADASAAVQFALAVTQPQSTGIGGGCFILRRDGTTGQVTALDGREEAPKLFHPNVFCLDEDCLLNPECECLEGPIPTSERAIGGLAAGIPGVVAAAARLVADNGSLPLSTILGPAIALAEDGFVMYDGLHSSIQSSISKLRRFEATADLFLSPDRSAPRVAVGELFQNPDLASTLRLLATVGAQAFYTEGPLPGEIAEAAQNAVNEVTGKFGLMAPGDIEGYKAVYREPVRSTYRGREILGFPMPSSGGASLAFTLNYLEAWAVAPAHERSGMRPEHVGRFIDAQNAAFADRNLYMADGDFVDVSTN